MQDAKQSDNHDLDIPGDYDWLCRVTGTLRSTAQAKVSRGQIPGTIRFGPRLVRFDKRKVLAWIAACTQAEVGK